MFEIPRNAISPKFRVLDTSVVKLLESHLKKKKTNAEYRKAWAEKIVQYMNNDIKWKYDNVFKFKADVTIICDDKVNSSLDECFLDEDIGGFVGAYLYDSLETIKHNETVMKAIFGHEENLEMGQTILLANWNNWEPEN